MKLSKPRGSALIIIVIIVAVIAVGIGLFIVLNHKNTTTAPAATSPTPSSSSSGSTVTTDQVSIKDMAFSPNNITIAKGATVTWTNNDSTVHTVTANDGSFASDSLSKGKTYSHTFNTPGSYKYHCVIHPSMTGTVTVNP